MITKIEELLIEMLNIPSVSGNEMELGNFLISQLSDFKVSKQSVGKNNFNLIAKKGKPEVYIVVHMDTVPGEVSVKVTRDKIFGRGAIDNKGNIAGAIMAARELENIGLIFTVEEELDFAGAKKIKFKKGKFIVMEPTNLKIATSQRGVIGFDILAIGQAMHSSLNFKKEQSAVYLLTKLIQDLYKKNWTSFNAIITEGGEADNIVCAEAKASVTIRPKDNREYDKVMNFFSNLKIKNIKVKNNFNVRPCQSTLIKNKNSVGFFSEMAFFKNSILFGVGDIAKAHSKDEFVLRKDLNVLPEKLKGVIEEITKK